MIHRITKLVSATAAVGLLTAVQAACAQPSCREYYSRSRGAIHRADYMRAPLRFSSAGSFYGGDYYRPACVERRSGHRQTVCRTVRRGSSSATRCRTRQSEQYERRCDDYSEGHRRGSSCDRGRHDRGGISFGVWFGDRDRSRYRQHEVRRGVRRDHSRSAALRHRSQGRSQRASYQRGSSRHRSDPRAARHRRSSHRRHR